MIGTYFALLAALPMSTPASTHVSAVPVLDLSRYLGTWHEIARLPMFFQRKCDHGVTATYSLNADGTVRVHNACIEQDGTEIASDGVARIPDPTNEPAQLKVRFAPGWLGWLPFVWADYWVIALDTDGYRWAMVGQPGKKFLWILSREATLDRATFDALKDKARGMGYNLTPLIISGKVQ